MTCSARAGAGNRAVPRRVLDSRGATSSALSLRLHNFEIQHVRIPADPLDFVLAMKVGGGSASPSTAVESLPRTRMSWYSGLVASPLKKLGSRGFGTSGVSVTSRCLLSCGPRGLREITRETLVRIMTSGAVSSLIGINSSYIQRAELCGSAKVAAAAALERHDRCRQFEPCWSVSLSPAGACSAPKAARALREQAIRDKETAAPAALLAAALALQARQGLSVRTWAHGSSDNLR
jgi:hypothetical protein